MSRLEMLQSMPVFGGINDAALGFLLERAVDCKVTAGEYFFHEDDEGRSVFILEQGEVRVLKTWNGEQYTLNELSAGDCFGEMALIDLYPRSASVRATSDCLALELTHAALHELYGYNVKQFALIQMNMGREVSRRLRSVADRLFEAQIRDKTITPQERSFAA